VIETASSLEFGGERVGCSDLGLALDLDMVSANGLGGGFANAREPDQTERTDIVKNAADFLEEIPDAIGTREDEPVLAAKFKKHVGQGVVGDFFGDADQR
jgi:hypothetical protein